MSVHVVRLHLDLVQYFPVHVGRLSGQMHIYLRCPVATHAPATSRAITPQSMLLCPRRNELTLFSTNTCLKDGIKTQRNGITEVIDCNRLFPLAHQDCTTLAPSRKTVRNGSYPEKSKRTLQLASTEYDGIDARTTQHEKVPTKTLQHNSCFHVVFLLPLGTTSGSSKNCACALDHEQTRDRNNCKCRSTSSDCTWTSPHISPFTYEGSWDKCTFTGGCPVATHAPATTHAITPQSVLSVSSVTNLPCSPQTRT